MLSTAARRWPDGGRWVLQPKWDGFRLLIDVDARRRVRGWSRHGTDLTARLGSLLAPFETVAPGTTFDGELVAIGERGGQPTQDFAAVTRAVFTGKPLATDRLRLVVFDLLCVGGEDLRPRPWEERDARLHDALPACDRIRPGRLQPANPTAHDAIVALGLRGHGPQTQQVGIPSRPAHARGSSTKRGSPHARELRSVRQDREGRWHALCDVDGRRVHAVAGARTAELVGQSVELVYSRVDADGTLREARVAPAGPAAGSS